MDSNSNHAVENVDMEKDSKEVQDQVAHTGATGHRLALDDPENPFNWPMSKRIYVSAVATAFGFSVAYGLTSYSMAISGVMKDFDVSMTVAIIPFSLYLVGIAFAPIYTPHLSERVGRAPVYLVSLPIGSLFILGASVSKSFAALAICRFFAGFFGGACLVLIEGTYADVWPFSVTLSYYSVLTLASYIGAGCGPLINGFVFAAKGWRWTQYTPLMVSLGAYLFGIGMPETYAREILRRRARKAGQPNKLPKAQSGATLAEMAKITIVTPVIMLVSEPIVIFTTLYVSFLFGTIFQFFISIPPVLMMVFGFTIQQVGLAFIAALVGSFCAAATCIALDRLLYPRAVRKSNGKDVDIEYRLFPAMIGSVLMTASFFWIGWTAAPAFSWASPVVGTWMFVWGNMMVLVSAISYLFDAYPAAGTLSALTAAASMRLLVAAAIPLCMIQMITNLGGGWALSAFGFISAALSPLPFLLYFFGSRLRKRSRYSNEHTMMANGGR